MNTLTPEFALDLPAGRPDRPRLGDNRITAVATAFVRALWGSISQAHLALALPDHELRRLTAELSEATQGYSGDVAGATRRYLNSTTR